MRNRPNVLIITTHDTGRHLGCYGVDTVHTPAINALAEDGRLFTNYFASSPICSASRAAMLTGRHPQSNGLMLLTHEPWEWSLNQGEQHLSHILRDAGYHTLLFGLQHEAANVDTLGFQDKYAQHNAKSERASAIDVAHETSRLLRERAKDNTPFYAQIGFFETHIPFDFGGATPDDSKGVYVPPYLVNNEAATRELARLQGAVRKVDEAVQVITDALRENGLDENTIVVFTVDHGVEFPRAKYFLYDPGIEIAFIIRWPAGGIKGGQHCDWLLSNVDFLPTLLELIDVPIPDNVEGRSFTGAFGPVPHEPSRDAVFAMIHHHRDFTEMRCIRTKRFKLIRNFTPFRWFEVPVDVSNPVRQKKCPVIQLFDLAKDPSEFVNVANDPSYEMAYRDLDARLWSWLESVNDPILKGPVPTPYYREAMADYSSR